MTGVTTCNACNTEFTKENDQKLHYKSEWHRYNLKRKIAGVPGVTEALFLARETTLAEEKSKLNVFCLIYVDANGKKLVSSDGTDDGIELGSGGSELIITAVNDDIISTKAIGSREYLCYYRQRPRPSATGVPMTAVLAARYRSMGLSTVQSKENMVRMKVMKQMNRTGVDYMRSKMGMKSNVIRNLPKNVTH